MIDLLIRGYVVGFFVTLTAQNFYLWWIQRGRITRHQKSFNALFSFLWPVGAPILILFAIMDMVEKHANRD